MNTSEVIIKEGLWYTDEHEWARPEGDIAIIGVTDYAQRELRDIVFVELPPVGQKAVAMQELGGLESVKAISELISPVSGEVVEVNTRLEEEPGLINTDPYGEGWMVRVKMSDTGELKKLMDPKAYSKLMETLVD